MGYNTNNTNGTLNIDTFEYKEIAKYIAVCRKSYYCMSVECTNEIKTLIEDRRDMERFVDKLIPFMLKRVDKALARYTDKQMIGACQIAKKYILNLNLFDREEVHTIAFNETNLKIVLSKEFADKLVEVFKDLGIYEFLDRLVYKNNEAENKRKQLMQTTDWQYKVTNNKMKKKMLQDYYADSIKNVLGRKCVWEYNMSTMYVRVGSLGGSPKDEWVLDYDADLRYLHEKYGDALIIINKASKVEDLIMAAYTVLSNRSILTKVDARDVWDRPVCLDIIAAKFEGDKAYFDEAVSMAEAVDWVYVRDIERALHLR